MADVNGAAEAVRAAVDFNWIWAADDLELFCSSLGWRVSGKRTLGASFVTNLNVNSPSGHASTIDGLEDLFFSAADLKNSDGVSEPESFVEIFDTIAGCIDSLIGRPGTPIPGSSLQLRWDRQNLVVVLWESLDTVTVWFKDPVKLAMAEAADRALMEDSD